MIECMIAETHHFCIHLPFS